MRWTLARPGVRLPRWGGTATDTRIAYLSGDRLRVVAGDGTDDAAAGERAARRESHPPGAPASGSSSRTPTRAGSSRRSCSRRAGSCGRRPAPGTPRSLEWSSDAEQLLVAALPGGSRSSTRTAGAGSAAKPAPEVVAAAYRPGTHAFAELHRCAGGSRITLGGRTLFSFGGELRGLTWSPDGRWLLDRRRPRPTSGCSSVRTARASSPSRTSASSSTRGRSRVSRAGAARRIGSCSSPAPTIPDVPVWTALREEPVGLRAGARQARDRLSSASTSSTGRRG